MITGKFLEPLAGIEEEIGLARRVLCAYPGVRRVWLFGSAARGRRLDWRSDFDFAVEGLEADLQGRAWSELDQAVSRPVDLVRWEDAGPTLRAEILKWGKLIHEP